METWEYRTFNQRLSETELNDLGSVGWELVTHSLVASNEMGKANDIKHYFVLKRQKGTKS